MRAALVGLGLLVAACAGSVPVALARADARLNSGAWHEALVAYDAVAARAMAGTADQVRALVGGAQACDHLDDAAGARARLERAAVREIPGVTEPAFYYLAEHVQGVDRARALNLYYRAAAGAEKRGGGFPYRAAMDRIVQLSVAP